MPTADSILGPPPKPLADDILGPPPVEGFPGGGMRIDQAVELQRQASSKTGLSAIGRVLDAFGQGAAASVGEQVGLDPTTEKELRNVGILADGSGGIFEPFQVFTAMVLRPAAFLLELPSVVLGGTGAAISQTLSETGMMDRKPDPAAAAQQFNVLSQVAVGPLNMTPRLPRVTPEFAPAKQKAPIVQRAQESGVLGERPPVIPEAPISMKSDIDPGQVIATGAAKDTAGNVNLKNINSPDDVKDVIRETANSRVIAFGDSSPFIDARRGVQTHEMTRELSVQLGMTPEQLMQRQKGQAFNAEEALAARNLLVQSAANVKELSAKVVGGSDQALLEFEEAVTRHVAIQEQVAGMTAEAGRALQSFRIKAGETLDVKALLERSGGRDRIERVAAAIQTLEPEQVGAFVRKARKATTMDMVREVWINMILSGFRTHEANIIGNTITSLAQVPETAIAGVIGKLHGGEKVVLGETGAAAFGLVQGARDGLVAAWKALKAGEPSDLRGKIEAQQHKAITGENLGLSGRAGTVADVIGGTVRIPGRLLMAEDEFFKTVNYRAEINRQAVRKASREGLSGKEYRDKVAELRANPTDKMMEKARQSALYQSFQTELGDIGKLLMRLRDNVPGGWLVAPFVRTPINITKYAAERSPFGLLMREVRDNLKGKNGNVARDTQIARMAIGTGVGYATYSLAAEGFISGNGAADHRQRAVDRMSGWAPYSVKIGDKWYGYNRLDPYGLMMGVAADLYELRRTASADDAENIGAMIVGSASTALLNKTWLSGPAQLMAAVNEPERYGDAYVQRLAGSLVPAVVAQFAPEIDPVLRDIRQIRPSESFSDAILLQARQMLDAIRVRTPGDPIGKAFDLEKIYGKRDIFGEEIRRDSTVGGLLTPISESTINQDPVVRELIALEVFPAKLDREIKGVDLTAQQYDEFQQVAGRLMKIALTQVVTQPGWRDAPEFARKEVIEAIITSSRSQGRAYMLMKHPQILEDAIKAKTSAFQ